MRPRLPAYLWATIAIAGARAAYAHFACPYTLIEDEAHYWQWAGRLDAAYYSKGPGIALLIRAATEALGSSEAAIRTGSILCGAAGAIAIAMLSRDFSGHRHAPLLGVALFSLLPFAFAPALVATTDMPHLACWAWAALAAWRAVRGNARWWIAFAIALAIGLLFRSTIVALAVGAIGFAAGNGRARPALAASLAGLAGLAPILAWNALHGWPTFRHHLGHLGAPGGDMPDSPWTFDPRWLPEMVGALLGLVGPAIALMIGGVRGLARAGPPARSAARFALWTSLPLLAFYLLVSLRTDVEGTWPTPAFVTLIPAAAWAMLQGPGRSRRPLSFAALAYALIGGAAMLRLDLVDRVAPGVISTRRFLDADIAARGFLSVADGLRSTDAGEPFLIAKHYGRASLAAYYTRRRVFCASRYLGGRPAQQDLWPDHDLGDPSLLGRSAVLIGGEAGDWSPAFERIEGPRRMDGRSKIGEIVFIGHGFRGASAWDG